MFKYLVSFALSVGVFTASVFAGEPEDFNKAYWLSKPPAVRVLAAMEPYTNARTQEALKLALPPNSLSVDMEIDAFGAQPWYSMKNRIMYGYTWVPSMLQPPIPVAPGLEFPGQPVYNPNNPPAGSIRVSANIDDYKPFDPPPPPPPAVVSVTAEPNWTLQSGGWAPAKAFDKSPDGTVYDGPKGKWVKVVTATPFGSSAYWLRLSEFVKPVALFTPQLNELDRRLSSIDPHFFAR